MTAPTTIPLNDNSNNEPAEEGDSKALNHRRVRSSSFATIDEAQASGILTDVFREHAVFLGGSSIGKGLQTAARYHMKRSIAPHTTLDYKEEEEDDEEEAGGESTMEMKKNGGLAALQRRPSWMTKSNSNLSTMKGAVDLDPRVLSSNLLEDAFYIVDLGVIVSQVYQWRKYLPRVEPFYAVKCNPDPAVVKTLAIMGCHFDVASKQEITLVQDICREVLPSSRQSPDLIYANPTKARGHIIEAVCRGVRMMTFDNASEVYKCAQISKSIQLLVRIITDDRGSQCRLSSKFGAPMARVRSLLKAAQHAGLAVVGVSFHVGSGCRDASRYYAALQDARRVFDMAKNEFGMEMTILDIGGGFPGETHSVWNPADLDALREEQAEGVEDELEGLDNEEAAAAAAAAQQVTDAADNPYMFFTEIAEAVAPMIDELFPSPKVRVIGEPGRYFVAAAATLCASIVSARSNQVDETTFEPEPISDKQASHYVDQMTRSDEVQAVESHVVVNANTNGGTDGTGSTVAEADLADGTVLDTIVEELNDYSKFYAKQGLVQQEADVYNDALDLYKWDIDTAADLLGMPDELQMIHQVHTVEGMTKSLAVDETGETGNVDGTDGADAGGILTLAAAGEAAVNGIVLQAVADSAPLQDDFAYYINDGVYGAFNNIMFDHASVRPRVLKKIHKDLKTEQDENGFITLLDAPGASDEDEEEDKLLYASTVFGPTCDSIDVIARSVLLPKLKIGDWLYFQNMGAYTMAAASSFNGFAPTEKMYVCSVQPEFFESLIVGPSAENNGSLLPPMTNTAMTSNDITTDDEEKKHES